MKMLNFIKTSAKYFGTESTKIVSNTYLKFRLEKPL